jgi:ribosome maturation factor RimP
MTRKDIIEALEGMLTKMGCFLVELTVSAENDIVIYFEKEEGQVDWDDCSALDKAFHEVFDQDAEDYSLTVSSAGLDRPFKVMKQFAKAAGSKVTVSLKGGRRFVATLEEASESEGVTLSWTAREIPEGGKKKENVFHRETIPFAEINSVTPYIDFE